MANDKRAASENTKISTLDDGPDDIQAIPESTAIRGSNHDDALSGERVSLTIFEQEGDVGREAVPIGVNGVGYLIPRGKPFSVPAEVVHALDNCVQTIYESLPGGETRERRLKRFNYTVHGRG
ncbi:hypothetical protein AAKU55_005262 [Oxalobacteraceae bacterium GrIS 1.11]